VQGKTIGIALRPELLDLSFQSRVLLFQILRVFGQGRGFSLGCDLWDLLMVAIVAEIKEGINPLQSVMARQIYRVVISS
jgi:hypothetical protein